MYFLFNVILYSIFGFMFESCVCLIMNKPYDSGFTFGPYTLIYGFSLAIIFSLFRFVFKHINRKVYSYLVCFLISFVLISIFEFSAGMLLEKLFDATYWSYSDMPLTFFKYVNLFVSLFWASASLLIFKFILPLTDKTFKYVRVWMILSMTSLILVDVFFSVISKL